jgi:hypothetical protein
VHEYENRHGYTVYYLRRPGHKKVRLRISVGALPWSPEAKLASWEAKHCTLMTAEMIRAVRERHRAPSFAIPGA